MIEFNGRIEVGDGNDYWNWLLSASQAESSRMLIITTYSAPHKLKTVAEILKNRTDNTYVIAHEDFKDNIEGYASFFSGIQFFTAKNFHAKLILLEPDIVIVGSKNFGRSNWAESAVRIKSVKAFKYYTDFLSQRIPALAEAFKNRYTACSYANKTIYEALKDNPWIKA